MGPLLETTLPTQANFPDPRNHVVLYWDDQDFHVTRLLAPLDSPCAQLKKILTQNIRSNLSPKPQFEQLFVQASLANKPRVPPLASMIPMFWLLPGYSWHPFVALSKFAEQEFLDIVNQETYSNRYPNFYD